MASLGIEKTLAQCAIWQRTGLNLTIAINISAVNLQDDGFSVRVAELVKELNCRCKPEIKVLSEMGAQISIDDFGTGYSSMTYLKKLLVAKIKIDKSFVMEMSTDKNDSVIVQSAIYLGHLDMKIVSEV